MSPQPSVAVAGRQTSTSSKTVSQAQAEARRIASRLRKSVEGVDISAVPRDDAALVYECYRHANSGRHLVVPVRQVRLPNGRTSHQYLPPLSNVHIRKGVSNAPRIRGWLPPIGGFAKKGYVWACHLQRCICEDTGEVYYQPIVFMIEQAKAPNNTPVEI